MDEVNTSQNIQNAETGDFPENTAGSPVPSSELKSKKKKRIILGTVGLILVIVLVLTFAYIRGSVFSRAVHEMLSEYPYADRVNFSVGAIHGNASHNHQPQMLRLDNFDDLTQLLCASGEAGDFQSNDRVPRLCLFQKRGQLTLHGSVPVFVF